MSRSEPPWWRRPTFVFVAVSGVLAIATLQLLRLGSRGAEIANVLQIPISLLTLLGALWAIWSPESSPDAQEKPVPQRPLRLRERIRRVSGFSRLGS